MPVLETNITHWADLLKAIAGTTASVISLGAVIVQTLRVRALKHQQHAAVWNQIASSKAMMRHLEREDVQQAMGLASQQFRDLLESAVLLESKFGMATIDKWRTVGKLSSDWQERQALMLLTTKSGIREGKVPSSQYASERPPSNWDQSDDTNPVAKLSVRPHAKPDGPSTPHTVG